MYVAISTTEEQDNYKNYIFCSGYIPLQEKYFKWKTKTKHTEGE